MMRSEAGSLSELSARQRQRLREWFGDVVVLHDHSWGETDTVVLEVQAEAQHCIVKAFGPANHHFEREAHAHRALLSVLTRSGRAPKALHIDDAARMVVTQYLPGSLVQGDTSEWEPETYRQAGQLLAMMHGQAQRTDHDMITRSADRSLQWLEEPHQIPARTERELRAALESIRPQPVPVVPTHGDWQPRNWLMHQGQVGVIDFGRAAWRPPVADFTRLTAQQFRGRPHLAAAFFHGYGPDPRVGELWQQWQLFEAIGTAVYAFRIGAPEFEEQGHRMIADALALVRG